MGVRKFLLWSFLRMHYAYMRCVYTNTAYSTNSHITEFYSHYYGELESRTIKALLQYYRYQSRIYFNSGEARSQIPKRVNKSSPHVFPKSITSTLGRLAMKISA